MRSKTILGATTSSKLPLMPSLVMTTMAGIQFPVPYAFSLRGLAERLPGGVTGMLTLAWLSGDSRARAVRNYWNFIPRETRGEIAVEELCQRAGIEPGELVGLVTRTAYNLGMDVTGVVIGVRLRAPNGTGRTLTSVDMARLRRRLGLAARQFAQVLGVGLRTVQGWDAGVCDPHREHRVVVELVTRYVHHFGVETFRERCVGEGPRFAKPGRPPRLANCTGEGAISRTSR